MFYTEDEKTNDYIADQVERMFFYADRVSDACDYTEFFQDIAEVFSAASNEERMDNMIALRDKIALRLAKVVTLPNGELALPPVTVAQQVVDAGSAE